MQYQQQASIHFLGTSNLTIESPIASSSGPTNTTHLSIELLLPAHEAN